MLNLDISKVIAVWGKAPLKVNPYQCLPLRYPKSSCRLCVENCPTTAIEIKEDSISVIDDKCTGCGICYNLCPTGVFEMTNFTADAFVEYPQGFKEKMIYVECFKVPHKYSLPQSLRLPCLAYITPSLLLKLISKGAGEIMIRDAGICEACESKCGDKGAKDTISKTQELLKDIGLKQKVSVIIEGISINNLDYEGNRLKDYKDDPELSRREIFSMFKKETKRGIGGLINKEKPLNIKGKKRLKKVLAKEREEILNALKEVIADKTGDEAQHLYGNNPMFSSVNIADGCNMCQLCCFFCPTDALTVEDTEKGQGILFKTATCIGCKLCIEVCPKDVLILKEKEFLFYDIINQSNTTLVWFDKNVCEYCGRVFTKTTYDNLCDICLKEKEI